MRALHLLALLAIGAGLAFVPNLQDATGFPAYYLIYGYFLFFWIAQATSWNILSGYSGYFSFGQGAFYGLGVYAAGDLMTREEVNYFVTIPIAGVLGAALGGVVGALAFRLGSLRGEIFALLTLAVTFTLSAIAQLSTWVDGGQGIAIAVPEYPAFLGEFQDLIYRLGLVVALMAVITAFLVQHSRFGWGLFSIRDEEGVAEELGVPTFRYKMLAIMVTGFLGGVSGAVAALQIGYLTPDVVFSLTVPLLVVVMCVLGGRTHWLGPVIGAVVIYGLQERLTNSGFDEWGQVILGAILVLVVLYAPEGLYARLRARPQRAPVVAVTLVAVTVVSGFIGRGIATDWVANGLVAATLVLLVGRPQRRGRVLARRELAAAPSTDNRAR